MDLPTPPPGTKSALENIMQHPALKQAQAAITSGPEDAPLTDQDLLTRGSVADDVAPPAYCSSNAYPGEIHAEKSGLGNSAAVTDDGRVNIRINHLNRRLSQVFTPALRRHVENAQHSKSPPPAYIAAGLGGDETGTPPPKLNVVIQVVGSRGDVQPFVALGKVLRDTYGHRVRLATHPVFKDFVEENGLEFFSIGGDPGKLMSFMVKNPGLIPSFRTLMSGDVGERRREVAEYIQGCWRSCYQAGNGMPESASLDTDSDGGSSPFVADCIIANPPSFAHIHCAEKLGVPLHIMFTMPYSPTQAFPHPLANVQASDADAGLTNWVSYAMIDVLSWQGLGDIINRFRAKCLGLDPVSLIWAPNMLQRLEIPHTYCWSPALIPKPADWASHISISGFFLLNYPSYTPSPDLQAFIAAGPPPVYIGFGSIVLEDPNAMTELVFEAARKIGQRVLLSKGWGGMGAEESMGRVPEGVFMLGNVPHDWLFKRVKCVVHHGGAGTTAAGITAGKPTVVVPFFGDQFFWGAMVAQAGAGPNPIPHRQLTADKLADAISFCLRPESVGRAEELASKISTERGCDTGAQSFHQHLDIDNLRCTLAPSRSATWRLKRTQVRLSAFAACTLANAGLLDFSDLKLYRPREYATDEGPWDPVSGFSAATFGAFASLTNGLSEIPSETWKAMQMPFTSRRRRSQSSVATISRKPVGGRSSSKAELAKSESSSDIEDHPAPVRFSSRLSIRSSGASISSASTLQGPSTPNSTLSRRTTAQNTDKIRLDAAHKSKGLGRMVKTLVQAPMDMSLGITKGFHNAPKLWGDETVRPQQRVKDLNSGMAAIGKEFGYGMYDGVTGLVTQPWNGAKKEGWSGFAKGFGKGVGGLVAKPGAALFGIPSYFMKGAYKEVQKMLGGNVKSYIIASRTAQGYEEWLQATEEEREDAVACWSVVQKVLKGKAKGLDEVMREELYTQGRTSRGSDACRRPWNFARSNSTGSGSASRPASRAYSESLASTDLDLATDHGHLAGATQAGFEAHQQQGEKTSAEKAEEQVVLEYIKKQSLLKTQHRNRDGARATAADEEDAELRQALEMSMREHERSKCGSGV